MSKARRTSSTVARGTVPTTSRVYGFSTSITRSRRTRSPPMRSASSRKATLRPLRAPGVVGVALMSGPRSGGAGARREMVEGDVEDIEVAQPAGRQVGRRPVEKQRHHLLGDAAVGAQRRVQPGEVVA